MYTWTYICGLFNVHVHLVINRWNDIFSTLGYKSVEYLIFFAKKIWYKGNCERNKALISIVSLFSVER